MHLQGMYFVDALRATVCNMFRSKGQKPYEYPSEPYTFDYDYEDGLDMEDEEQRDIAIQRRNFVAKLNTLFGEIDQSLQEREDGYR